MSAFFVFTSLSYVKGELISIIAPLKINWRRIDEEDFVCGVISHAVCDNSLW